MNIELFIALDGNEIYFFLVQNPNIDLISAPKQFNGNDIFKYAAIIQILGSQLRLPEGVVAQLLLITGGQILFPLNVIPAYAIESKGIAQILHIVSDGLVVDFILVARESVCNISRRREI